MKTTILTSLICLCIISVAEAETRAVSISITQTKEKKSVVSIWSDEKSEVRTNVSLDEARLVVQQMKGWGSAVMVFVVADSPASLPAVQDVLKDASANTWLVLSYLRVGDPKSGETFAKSRSIEPPAGGDGKPAPQP